MCIYILNSVAVRNLHYRRSLLSIILVSDRHMPISEASKAISVWEEPRLVTPAQMEDQCSTLNFTHHCSPTNSDENTQRETASKAQDYGRINSRSKYQPRESNPASINTLSKEWGMVALMSPARICLGKGPAPQKGHLLQPLPSSEEDTSL